MRFGGKFPRDSPFSLTGVLVVDNLTDKYVLPLWAQSTRANESRVSARLYIFPLRVLFKFDLKRKHNRHGPPGALLPFPPPIRGTTGFSGPFRLVSRFGLVLQFDRTSKIFPKQIIHQVVESILFNPIRYGVVIL